MITRLHIYISSLLYIRLQIYCLLVSYTGGVSMPSIFSSLFTWQANSFYAILQNNPQSNLIFRVRHRKLKGPEINPFVSSILVLSTTATNARWWDQEIENCFKKLEWQSSPEIVLSSFNNHGVYSFVFYPDTYWLWTDRLKDISKSLFPPSGVVGCRHISHFYFSVCLLFKSDFAVLLYIPKAADMVSLMCLLYALLLFVHFTCFWASFLLGFSVGTF